MGICSRGLVLGAYIWAPWRLWHALSSCCSSLSTSRCCSLETSCAVFHGVSSRQTPPPMLLRLLRLLFVVISLPGFPCAGAVAHSVSTVGQTPNKRLPN